MHVNPAPAFAAQSRRAFPPLRTAAWFLAALGCAAMLLACDRRKPLDGEEDDLGRPPILEMSADRETVTGVKDTFLTVRALLVNANHGTLAGRRVEFQARIGFIATHDSTNDSGVAQAFYYTRLRGLTGPAFDTVIATYDHGDDEVADTLVLRLVPGAQMGGDSVGSLVLGTSRTKVQVRGTGDEDQAVISARVFDLFGNPIQDGAPVTFRLLRGPGGGESLGAGMADTASTRGGAATVTFRSGTRIGVVEIEAASRGHVVRQTLLTVTSGPPERLTIMVRPDSSAMAGIRWRMEVQAQLADAYLNPVKDSVGVLFTLDPRGASAEDVSIQGSAFTGNLRCADTTELDCLPVPGSAFTTLAYGSGTIFDTLSVAAETSTGNRVVRGSLVFRAPLQRPVVRANYYGGAVFAPSFDPVDTLTIHGTLADGVGSPVPGASLCIATDGGVVLDKCRVTDPAGKAEFRMTMSLRDKTSLALSRVISVNIVEQSTGATGATSFLAIFPEF